LQNEGSKAINAVELDELVLGKLSKVRATEIINKHRELEKT
jgi:hypothetical protein